MSRVIEIYGRKIFSLTLIFNSLLTIVFAIGLLASYYTLYPNWTPYPPFIPDGRLLWILIPATIVNIFPCVNIGKVHTGRLWFHHYVYGIIVAAFSTISTQLFATTSNINLFTIYTTDVGINLGRFLILGGTTLFIDDLPDVSKRLKTALTRLKIKAHHNGNKLHTLQLIAGVIELYFLTAISLYIYQHPTELTLANVILIATLLITTITSLAHAKRRAWLNVKTETPKQPKITKI